MSTVVLLPGQILQGIELKSVIFSVADQVFPGI